MLNNKFRLILTLFILLVTLIIPSFFFLILFLLFLIIFDYFFLYKYYIPFLLFVFLISTVFFNLNISLLITVKFIIYLGFLSNYIKNTSLKKFKSNSYRFISLFHFLKLDINRFVIIVYKPYFINKKSDEIKKYLSLQGIDVYYSNIYGKILVYKQILLNINRLVDDEIKKTVAIL